MPSTGPIALSTMMVHYFNSSGDLKKKKKLLDYHKKKISEKKWKHFKIHAQIPGNKGTLKKGEAVLAFQQFMKT